MKVFAKFRPQANINDYAVDIDGGYEFEITSQISELGLDAALALEDNHEERDNIWRSSKEGMKDPHYGPFEVELDYEQIRSLFAE